MKTRHHRKYRDADDNYDSKPVVEPHEIFYSTRRQIGAETRRLKASTEKRKSYVAFSQSIANWETSSSHWLFFTIGRRQITWIEKCKGPLRRKRNRQSEAEMRRDVEERRSIVAETVQKLSEKRCNFDASRVYKLVTIISGSVEIAKAKFWMPVMQT